MTEYLCMCIRINARCVRRKAPRLSMSMVIDNVMLLLIALDFTICTTLDCAAITVPGLAVSQRYPEEGGANGSWYR